MSILRKRSAQYKVHIPADARENQYLLAKFRLNEEFLAQYAHLIDSSAEKPYAKLYQFLSTTFFELCNEFAIETCQFVGTDKFTRVRYSPERFCSQTEEQILFLYNPEFHFNQGEYFDGSVLAKKVTLVFLANGTDIRYNAAQFHQKVAQALNGFIAQVKLPKEAVRVCDHQHVTYDLFAKEKGNTNTQATKLRSIVNRYQSQSVDIPKGYDELSYAIVNLPITRRIQQLVTIDTNEVSPYNDLYRLISDAFLSAAAKQKLSTGAFIANGLVPVVRENKQEKVFTTQELQMLGYNPKQSSNGIICKWSADKLVDTVQFILVAEEQNKLEQGYGRFLHQVENVVEQLAKELSFIPNKEELIVRFHQHIGFYR